MSDQKPSKKQPKVHKELEGLKAEIDQFGEVKINMDIDKINEFLNKHVEDKKLGKEEEK